MRRAFTLLEVMVTMGIVLILSTVTMPMTTGIQRDARFQAFAAEFAANLNMARQRALISETPIYLDFTEPNAHFGVYRSHADDRQLIAISQADDGFEAEITCRLPIDELDHPTSLKPLETAFRSTHDQRIIFAGDGSSSATVVFSDANHRAVCAVVSSTTGRFRVFIRLREGAPWRLFH